MLQRCGMSCVRTTDVKQNCVQQLYISSTTEDTRTYCQAEDRGDLTPQVQS
jgi:hypothetical protein